MRTSLVRKMPDILGLRGGGGQPVFGGGRLSCTPQHIKFVIITVNMPNAHCSIKGLPCTAQWSAVLCDKTGACHARRPPPPSFPREPSGRVGYRNIWAPDIS